MWSYYLLVITDLSIVPSCVVVEVSFKMHSIVVAEWKEAGIVHCSEVVIVRK
jgi:hypothetical protein